MEASLISHSLSSSPHPKGEDPWDECIQSGCKKFEAGEIQPFVCNTAAEFYHRLRDFWALQREDLDPRLLRNPFARDSQAARAVAFLLAQKQRPPYPPLVPQFPDLSLPQLSELCQLALLWKIAGQEDAAQKLAHLLALFARELPLLSLWCTEHEYNENEGYLSFSLLLRALGQKQKSAELFSKTPDPFFLRLANESPLIEAPTDTPETIHEPVLGLSLYHKKRMTAAFTLSGRRTSLGIIRSDVEIRAMGPAALPLSDSNRFGIWRMPDGKPIEGWTRAAALPEVWMNVQTEVKEENCRLSLRFVGLKPELPLAFAFYLKASSAKVEQLVVKPKNLQRYLGGARVFQFRGKQSGLKIESALSHKVQLIPLAGDGGFWNCDFLLSFEIHPVEASADFLISCE